MTREAAEIVENQAALYDICDHLRKRKNSKPGEVILGMSEEKRNILKQLKSEDISPEKVSIYAAWCCYEPSGEKRLSDLKIAFDRKFLKIRE